MRLDLVLKSQTCIDCSMRFSTRAIHAGQDPDPVTGSVTVPVYLTSTYQQPGPGKEGKYVYSRTANPTRTALEECLASLEAGRHGPGINCGMAGTKHKPSVLVKGRPPPFRGGTLVWRNTSIVVKR